MEEAKLIRVLKTLDTREFKRFRSYVESPYANKNKKLISLLDFIAKFHPNKFDSASCSYEKAFSHVFRGEQFKGDAINKLLSKLFKLLADFFTVESSLASEFEIEYNLLKEYWKRHLSNDFERISQKIRKKQRAAKHLKTDDFYNKYLIEREINREKSTRKDRGVGDAHFQDASSALDIYYLYTKLLYTCQAINRNNVFKGVEMTDFNTQMVEMIPNSPYKNEPIIDIWYSAYQLLSSEDKSGNYYALKDKLYAQLDIPDKSQLRMLFTFLENSTLVIFKQRKDLYEELIGLYDFQMERDILLNDEVFIPTIIRNYMRVSLNLGRIQKAHEFLNVIEEQVKEIHPNDFQFCRAMILFTEKEYEKTLDIMNDINFTNIVMKLNERTMRLKVYYHLGYHDLLYDSLNSFRVFLTNNKEIISDRVLDANRRFSNYLSKILKNISVVSTDFEELEDGIRSDYITMERAWLLEQVNLLKR